MTKKQSLIFRLSILFFGLIIIYVAYLMFAPSKENILPKQHYLWANIALIYIISMCPSLFITIRKESFSKSIYPILAMWSIVSLYIIAGALLILFVMIEFLAIKIAILLQMILFFVFAIAMYGACFTGSHIANVATKEKMMMERLNIIKQKAQLIQAKLNKDNECHRELAKLMESLTFLSPASNIEAYTLEAKIIAQLDILQSSIENHSANASIESIEKTKDELNNLYQMRKIILL